jgi:hypothetical protein
LPDQNAWSQFVSSVVSHYAYLGDNIVFGIWNEPDGDFLNCNGQAKGTCWGQFLWNPATVARNTVNPGAVLAGPDMGTLDGRLDDALDFFNFSARPQDIVTTHWYNHGDSQDWWVQNVTNKAGGRKTWLTETGVNRCDDNQQASEVDNYVAQFVFSGNAAWNAYMYYQVTQGPGDLCFGVRGRPAFDKLRQWADFVGGVGGGGPEETHLNPGESLSPDQSITSPNGRYQLKYQPDGNLVLYDNGSAIWAINCWPDCNNIGAPGMATMQSDGNFVVYDSGGGPVFHTSTNGNPGAYLAVRDDGNLVVYAPGGGSILWQR